MLARDDAPLKTTPLDALHRARGGRLVPFAGYALPVHYAAGVLREHLHCRAAAGLFDVSHMGQIALRALSGDGNDAARALERLTPQDILGLADGRQRYAQFTTDAGGVLDDLMVARRGDTLLLVVNAACKDADLAYLRARLPDCVATPLDDRALLALQGPKAEAVLAALDCDTRALRFMDVADRTLCGAPAVISRSGYTGDDGFEISLPAQDAERIAAALLDHPDVLPIGLGARDSLRLEAGLCLYGHDLDPATTPVEAALEWSIQNARRRGGEREGGFPGAEVILDQLARGAPRRRVGLKPEGRAPVREGVPLFADETAAAPVGAVTSGGFGPSLNAPVAMGFVASRHAEPGARLFAEVRGQRLPLRVVPLPFVPTRYKR